MKIDNYMPFYGSEFFQACEGHTDAVVIGYMRAVWHYWQHTHCAGLPDDDDYLRRLCRCDSAQWVRTKGIIFGNNGFFRKGNDGLWHQKKAKTEYDKALASYQDKVDRLHRNRGLTSGADITPPNQHVRQSSSSSLSSKIEDDGVVTMPPANPKPTDEADALPAAPAGEVIRLLGYVKDKFGLPLLDANTERLRGNLSELLGRGYKPEQIEEVCRWAKAPHGKAGCPQSAVSATDPIKFSQWLTTMENHATQIEQERKRRNK